VTVVGRSSQLVAVVIEVLRPFCSRSLLQEVAASHLRSSQVNSSRHELISGE